jgi:hypothetical protein
MRFFARCFLHVFFHTAFCTVFFSHEVSRGFFTRFHKVFAQCFFSHGVLHGVSRSFLHGIFFAQRFTAFCTAFHGVFVFLARRFTAFCTVFLFFLHGVFPTAFHGVLHGVSRCFCFFCTGFHGVFVFFAQCFTRFLFCRVRLNNLKIPSLKNSISSFILSSSYSIAF